MHDKVLGFIRETLLHENLFDGLIVDLAKDEVRINLLQPDRGGLVHYLDPSLLLTFSGVSELGVRRSFPDTSVEGELVLGIECTAEGGVYHATILVGNESSVPLYRIALRFEGLGYDCYPG